MRPDWDSHLERWIAAGVVDLSTAGRIREWETAQGQDRGGGLRWPTIVALVFGALMLGAGVLLFVSAHWYDLSPGQRLSLVVLMTAIFHLGGAFSSKRFEGMSVALHAIGTLTLGAGIALAGQIYHLSEHWPGAVLMWGAGAAAAWALLRQWPQAALTAMLIPFWIGSEWTFWMERNGVTFFYPVSVGACALSFAYLGGRRGPTDDATRKALSWIGGILLLPAALGVAVEHWGTAPDWRPQGLAWAVALVVPVAVAFLLRGFDLLWTVGALAWTLILAWVNWAAHDSIPVYLWCLVGAAGLVAWGVRESRPERINLGMAGFAITLLVFYFSDVMDKLDRSASLMLLGILFLGGGWLLERLRRRLIAGIRPEAAA
jgi:uncharacterized membrane protein